VPARPDCVVVSARALSLVTTPAMLRRARVAHRGDGLVYRELLALTAVVLGGADATKVAVDAPAADAWIMTDEAARRLRVTPNAVRRMLREGRLRGTRRGTVWLVDVADLTRVETAC
jgi:excisionase family DNA binding protein